MAGQLGIHIFTDDMECLLIAAGTGDTAEHLIRLIFLTDILQQAGLEVRILVIPTGKDPDEYIKANGKEAFIKLTEQAISFMEYKIRGIKKKYDMNTLNDLGLANQDNDTFISRIIFPSYFINGF